MDPKIKYVIYAVVAILALLIIYQATTADEQPTATPAAQTNSLQLTTGGILMAQNTDTDDTLWQKTKNGAAGTWEKTKDVTSDTWESTKEVSSNVWEGTKEVSGNVWDKTKEVSSDAWEATKDGAEAVSDAVTGD